MTLLKKNTAPSDYESYSRTELISAVSVLSQYLEQASPNAAPEELAGHREIGARAIRSAFKAEQQIASQMKRIAHLEQLAVTDDLTGLLNRRGFLNELNRVLSGAARYHEQGVLAFVDLDGFKPVNDAYGHAAGDAVLQHVAKILLDSVRESDIVARMGGDEFCILLTRTEGARDVNRVDELDHALNRSAVEWNGRLIKVSASVGSQTYGPADKGEDLLSRADDAMYRMKRTRGGLEAGQASAS